LTATYQLVVETRGGVCDLSRVVGVLALYELTPKRLSVEGRGVGLTITAVLETQAQIGRRCAKRLAAFPAVTGVTWTPFERNGA
jgi:hypothetical protein